ncbi:MAG: exodeoxyribonuclease VII small subunit [Spirochaetes bacterium]|uniref:Exodeoxyribonuclease 7 small subunit n=1 Tax=Candidatus Gallitreponema excrementavium TaxID=2840840 RepID=A0A9D9HN17_9SPIR|nr:exodeoxyribonuclease VII small subunit [Candidatus Gallitreponema excrementavium]
MKDFEKRLARLEELSETINNQDLPLEDALGIFEEGIKLAKNLEKDLEKLEGRVRILMNQPEEKTEKPELDLFNLNGEEE